MANTGAKRSREERVTAALPVSLDRGTGTTRDVSASGVFFETDVNYATGSEISFAIELNGPAGKLMLKCQGQIVRVEDRGGKVEARAGLAHRLLQRGTVGHPVEGSDELLGARPRVRLCNRGVRVGGPSRPLPRAA